MGFLDKLTSEELKAFNRHYTRCEFDDECGKCDNPTNGSYATGYDDITGEVDDYICGKCAAETISNITDMEAKEYKDLTEYIESEAIKWTKLGCDPRNEC